VPIFAQRESPSTSTNQILKMAVSKPEVFETTQAGISPGLFSWVCNGAGTHPSETGGFA